ncbi:MAG TPA: DMT family transporter, partial [Gillisia sp.]|nr:DMT family transporter [Gillisia sp.]
LGLAGTLGLIFSGAQVNPDQNYFYSGLVIIAAFCYAVNVNIIKRYMHDISALGIAAGNFLVLLVPALLILYFTGFSMESISSNPEVSLSLTYVLILGVVGTGIALIIFNKLIQISDPVFSSSVTYTIPVIGLAWGLLDGEVFTWQQLISTVVILLGVFIVNRNKNLYPGVKKLPV